MAGKHFCFVRQGVQTCSDRLVELLEITAGKVGATHATTEKRIAREDPSFDGGIEADTPFGVTRGANHLQDAIAHFDFLVIFQSHIRKVDVADRLHSKPYRLALGLDNIGMRVGMCRNSNTTATFHGIVAHHMIDVAMGINNHQRLQLMAVKETIQTVFLLLRNTSGVDDDTFPSLFVINDKSVFIEGIENKRIQFEHDNRF